MIAVVDYDAGNIRSVENALHRIGADFSVSRDPSVIAAASHVLLPGVGHAGRAIESLRSTGLDVLIRSLRRPVLGICVGMQVMCRYTEEGDALGLGIFDADVRRLHPLSDDDKVPNTGWCRIANLESRLFSGIKSHEFVYFVHSYFANLCTDTIATARYGEGFDKTMFSAALKYENFYGTQFHPEKSGEVGDRILKNFLSL